MKKKYHRNKKVNMPNFSNMQNHINIYIYRKCIKEVIKLWALTDGR